MEIGFHVVLTNSRVDRVSATEAVDWFDSWSGQIKDYKTWYSQLSCLTFSNYRDSVEPPPCVVDRWAGGSLTRRPKSPFAVSWSTLINRTLFVE